MSTNFYPNGQTTVCSYYGASNDFRLQQIQHSTLSTQLSTFSYTYDADGQIQSWTQQADSEIPKTWVMNYDPVDQLLGALVRSNGITGAVLKRYLYGYDSAGNRTSEQIQSSAGVPPAITTANYNHLNQQTNTMGGGPVRFAGRLEEKGTVQLDDKAATMGVQNTNFIAYADTALGTNTITLKASDYSNNTRTNQYQLVVTNNGVAKVLSYDLNGNLINAVTATSTNSYEWDAANRLTKTTQRSPQNASQLVSEFTYDGHGRRVRIIEKTNGVAQSDNRFQWCDASLCEGRDSTGGTVTKRFFDQGEQISGTNYFFTRDHLGSIREMTDGSGALRARHEYDPYGRRMKVSGALEADFGFTGHYYHQASGLHFAIYRVYDSDTGRWISRDPAENAELLVEGPNLYGYVGNNTPNALDRLGLDTVVNISGGPILIDGNPGTGHGTAAGFQFSVVPSNGRGYGGRANPIPCFTNAPTAWHAYTNNLNTNLPPIRTTNSIFDVDGYYVNPTNRVGLRGDDQGPTTTLGTNQQGKVIVIDRSGEWGARFRYLIRPLTDP